MNIFLVPAHPGLFWIKAIVVVGITWKTL